VRGTSVEVKGNPNWFHDMMNVQKGTGLQIGQNNLESARRFEELTLN
jgi:hypothetical protein